MLQDVLYASMAIEKRKNADVIFSNYCRCGKRTVQNHAHEP